MTRLNHSFEQIRQFSTDVSHELRTPLTVVRGQLEVALFTAQTVEQYREAMADALEGVERLVQYRARAADALAGRIRAIGSAKDEIWIWPNWCAIWWTSTRFRPKRKACALRRAARELPAVAPTAFRSSGWSPTCSATPSSTRPRAASVNVSLIPSMRSREADRAKTPASAFRPDHLPHIFDRFYRVPSADPEKGLGLGLSFVAWIVKAHGGAVTVESTLKQGTRFTVLLPVGRSDSRIAARDSGRARPGAGTLEDRSWPNSEIQSREKEGIKILDLNGKLTVGGASDLREKVNAETRGRQSAAAFESEGSRVHR